jgi:phosphoribosylformimino-5-aminoimidazole carboxamide ribotide isomerase
MQVIPVIDVRRGVAVAAVRGDRARYRPLETPLADGADPVAVAQGLRPLCPFSTLYVADLDGIEGRGSDLDMQQRLATAWPGAELWIDDGSAGSNQTGVGIPPLLSSPTRGEERSGEPPAQQFPSPLWGGLGWGESQRSQVGVSHVLGSESLASLEDYEYARRRVGPAALLSLDFRGDDFAGPPELLADATFWPDRVIVMTLARVGSGEGPDLARLASVISRAGSRKVYAAGGVRHIGDLRALRDIGAAGALVATALHAGQIKTGDLEEIAG